MRFECNKKDMCRRFGAQVWHLRRIEELRTEYKPRKVKVLFIAESPPKQIEREVIKFFYLPEVKSYGLRLYLRRCLVETGFDEFGQLDDRGFLCTFAENGAFI